VTAIRGVRRRLAWLALVVLTAGWAATAWAEGWGGITAGVTTRREVEARYGRPTRERAVTEAGRTGSEWTYAGERAPQGLERLVVSFGLLRGNRFEAELVRGFALYPRPRVFTVTAITNGWGTPTAIGTDQATGRPALRYDAQALLVILDPSGEWAEVLVFAPERR
jgi:hypothetical protein